MLSFIFLPQSTQRSQRSNRFSVHSVISVVIIFFSNVLFAEKALENDWSVWQWVARLNGNYQYNSGAQDGWWIETTQPLYITPKSYRNTLFAQGEAMVQGSFTAFDVGCGYRVLIPGENWILGLNGFYDNVIDQRQGWSIGSDIQTPWVDLVGNYYGNNRGGNVDFTAPIPYLPWLRMGTGYFHWQTNGWRLYGIANIYGFLSLSGGTEQKDGGVNNFFRIEFNLGVPNWVQFTLYGDRITKKAFPRRNLKKFVLTPVERCNVLL